MPTVAETIEISKVSGYLSAEDVAKRKAFGGGAVSHNNAQMIFVTRRVLETIYLKDNNYEGLKVVSDYLYWLCGRFSPASQNIINNPPAPPFVASINVFDEQFEEQFQ